MRVLSLFIFCLNFSLSVCGQTETAQSLALAAQFQKYYNASHYDSVFTMFNTDMQKYLPLEKTTTFLSGIKAQMGNANLMEFVNYKKSYAVYKTMFDNNNMAVYISADNEAKINGISVSPFIDDRLPKIERNITKMQLPFKEEWTVVWGGDTKELNYHVESITQKNAFDILITDKKGNTFKNAGKENTDYYAFGKKLYAPCNGEVVTVVNGVADNKPGENNEKSISGNMVIIKTAINEFVVFCHFKNNTIAVKKGDQVKQGQLLGQCGNSGHSSEAHLHFHLQNGVDFYSSTGIKCFFNSLKVNGKIKTNYSPIQKDKVKL